MPTASGDEATIARAYGNVLRHCGGRGFKSVAVPALGAGTGRLPLARCAELLAQAASAPPPELRDALIVVVALHEGRGREAFEAVFGQYAARAG